ncbi:MAG: ABC transporter ATP-binding protein [Candidatus Aminicenantes bacterium]|nr:ABC transporter ATP-binding protein [Candidatus Aminicenantes bacterium]
MDIQIRGLKMQYPGGKLALKGVSLDIGKGMFGLLGPNGAGKTSLIKILATLLKPTAGSIRIDGLDLEKNRKQIRKQIGYLPQEFTSFPKLTAREFLDYVVRLKGIRSRKARASLIDNVLENVGLSDARDRRADKLSGGMKRRLGIAQSLIGGPRILIIDEPTVGLDPEERVRFRNLLSDLTREEKIILLSTHIVGDISSTCARIALLDEGEVVFSGPPGDLVERTRGKVWNVTALPEEMDAVKLRYPVVSSVPSITGYELRLVADSVADRPAAVVEPNLEDAYVYFMDSAERRAANA